MTQIPINAPSLEQMPFFKAMLESGDTKLAAQKLMLFALNRQNPIDMRFYCLVSNLVIESGKPLPDVWKSMVAQFGTMEDCLAALDDVHNYCGAPQVDTSHALDIRDAQRLQDEARDLDFRWVCIGSVAISIIDHQLRKIEPFHAGIKPHSAWSLMQIRTRNFYTAARKRIDRNMIEAYKRAFPYAHAEVDEADISALDYIQADTIKAFGQRLSVAYKANLIAAQRNGLQQPEVVASIYGIGRVLYAAQQWMKKANEHVRKIWPYKATTEKPPLLYATREMNDLWSAYTDLRKAVGLDGAVLTGDFAAKAEADYDSLVADLTGDAQFLVSKKTEANVAFIYADMSLAAIIMRLQAKQPLPLSWARDIYHRFGGKPEWRKFIGMCRNPKYWRGLPMDDVLDLRDGLSEMLGQWQYVKSVELTEDGRDATYNLYTPTVHKPDFSDHRYGIILRWRAMVVSCNEEEPAVHETDLQKMHREMWAWHYHHPGEHLPDYQLVWLWVNLKSVRALNRLLSDLGPIALPTRRRMRSIREADLKAMTHDIILRRARSRGIVIPKELEQEFLSKATLRAPRPTPNPSPKGEGSQSNRKVV